MQANSLLFIVGTFFDYLIYQECLKRFGHEGDQFVLIYREKETIEAGRPETKRQQLKNKFKHWI